MAYGRKSLSIVTPDRPEPMRPPPPKHLTPDESAEWIAIVGTMPADWFPRECHGALAALCRHTIRSRMLSGKIDAMQPGAFRDAESVRLLDRMLTMHDRETKAMVAILRAMRLTQQARLEKDTAGAKRARHTGSYYDMMETQGDD